jgi:hypothetical protein
MIELPRRSVTRFFIPLIDVLTLLFCIFLVMPLATNPEEKAAAELKAPGPSEVESNQAAVARMQAEIEKLRHAKASELRQMLVPHVLYINPDNGELYYRSREQPFPLRSQRAAEEMIERDRAGLKSGQELYYLIVLPLKRSGFPTEEQQQQYDRWFARVAVGYDNPRE